MKKRKYYYLVNTTNLETKMTIYSRVAKTEEAAREFLRNLYDANVAAGEAIPNTIEYDFFDVRGYRYQIESAVEI